eukprot:scaffold12970_cov67-Skeletonema_dohrnii-CCMP3373.AAC.1
MMLFLALLSTFNSFGLVKGWVGDGAFIMKKSDPEPDRGSDDYETYMIQLSNIEQEIDFFRGYHQPPTAEEYNRLCREHIST